MTAPPPLLCLWLSVAALLFTLRWIERTLEDQDVPVLVLVAAALLWPIVPVLLFLEVCWYTIPRIASRWRRYQRRRREQEEHQPSTF